MKHLKTYSLLLVAAASFAGCNGLKKMAKNASLVKYEVTPNPLELHGDSVAITVKGTYPAKYFAKKVELTATPEIKTSSGEHPFKAVSLAGEKSEANVSKINYKAGGSFNYTSKIAYTPDMKAGDVIVKVTGMKGKKTQDFDPIKIADATIATPLLVQPNEKAIKGKDNFQKSVPITLGGKIYYLVNTSKVNPKFNIKGIGVNNKDEMANIDSLLQSLAPSNIVLKGIDVHGYASPDGKVNINENLATGRSSSSLKYLNDMFKKSKMTIDSSMLHTSSTSEDWEGFQELMQASDMAQKDMILRIVASNTDVDAREMEIKKMGKAYTEIAKGIMPKLRKSNININGDKMSRTDEQISALVMTSPDSLGLEEIIYAGTLTTDLEKKLTIYKSTERIYPQDWRGANNAGAVLLEMKKVDEAQAEFEKADKLSPSNPIIKNNLGACSRIKGDRKTAAKMYAEAEGAGPEVNENRAALDILDGNYSLAVTHSGSATTFNAALAKLLAGDKDGAMSTLDSSPDKDSAIGTYLKAVISARKNDKSGVVSNLRTSIGKDASMKAMAKDDREFIKYFEDADFKSVVQ